jgi:hypothetical protein
VVRCAGCGKSFEGRADQRTCSAACRTRLYRRRKAEAAPAVEVVPGRPLQGSYLPEARHAPFERGNLARAAHGVHSERLMSERSLEVREEFLAVYPWLSGSDELRLDLFFTDLARYRTMDAWATDVVEGRVSTWVRDKGRPRSGSIAAVPEYFLAEMRGLSKTIGEHATALGLDPAGLSKILKDSSFARAMAQEGLDRLKAQGRAIRRSQGYDE